MTDLDAIRARDARFDKDCDLARADRRALLAEVDRLTAINPQSNFGDDENDRMSWQQDEPTIREMAWERSVRTAERARIRAAVEGLDSGNITDPQGYRIDSAEAMRASVLALLEEDR